MTAIIAKFIIYSLREENISIVKILAIIFNVFKSIVH